MSADIWLMENGEKVMWGEEDTIPMRKSSFVEDGTFNLTYNLSPMLQEAGMPPWRDFMTTSAATAGLIWEKVLTELMSDPAKYEAMNPSNGWGTYDGAVGVLSELVLACKAHPHAEVSGWL